MQQRVVARTVQGVQTVLSPAQDFVRTVGSSGIVLILAALLAFAWANSPWAADYFGILDTKVGVRFGDFALEKPLLLWVNDLLMALFFFLVGLEIKRELIVGELRSRRKAALPIAGALGGMLVPALIFIGLNLGQPSLRGWGIPMATDIAFALGVLALLGDRVSPSLKIFLLALAIVDDLGAVLVIAAFYTESLDAGSLGLAALAWVVALGYGRLGAARPAVFAAIGIVMWYFMLKSGIHSTVAGVLMALAVPLRHQLTADELESELRPLMDTDGEFEEVEVMIERFEDVLDRAHSPLHNMEHTLAPIVAFLIMPVFAFFNAGVAIVGGGTALVGPVSIGVALGLLLGKPIGIMLFAWLAVRSGVTELPAGTSWTALTGVAFLAGIGFTMSLFIGSLAFGPSADLDAAKVGVLVASVLAALTGLVFLSQTLPRRGAPAD